MNLMGECVGSMRGLAHGMLAELEEWHELLAVLEAQV